MHRKCDLLINSPIWEALSGAVHIDDEVTAIIAKDNVTFGRLRPSVWERNGIRLDTKLKVYQAVVLPTLLYVNETWTVYQRHAFPLELPKKSFENEVAGQDPIYRVPEEGKYAKRTYSIKACTAKIDRPCYENA